MKNLKISMKLLMPHTFILALLVLGMIVSFISFTNIRKQAETLYDEPFAVKNAAGTVNETLDAMQMSVYRTILNDAQDITDEAISEAGNNAMILQEQIALLKQYTSGDIGALSRLEANLSELIPMHEHVLFLSAQNKNAEALAYMENNNIPVINEAQKELAQFVQSAEIKERELMASLRQTQRNATILLIAFSIAGLLCAVKDGPYFWRLYKGCRQNSE